MDKPMSNFHFRFMSLGYKFRDYFKPREDVLGEVGIGPGSRILDYGCGPGSYTIIAAELAGPTGKVYALDIHPLALRKVRDAASKRGLANIETIQSDCATGLENGSIDVVLLFDIFHGLGDPNEVLGELHRVLRSEGTLSFSDHHMEEHEIISRITKTGLFKLSKKGKITLSFLKAG
jgi:ubiquinone/menaquinone biosynthesis C-methylase UbiE